MTAEISELAQDVMRAVRDLGKATPKEIIARTGENPSTVQTTLVRLAKDGLLVKPSRGVYEIPDDEISGIKKPPPAEASGGRSKMRSVSAGALPEHTAGANHQPRFELPRIVVRDAASGAVWFAIKFVPQIEVFGDLEIGVVADAGPDADVGNT